MEMLAFTLTTDRVNLLCYSNRKTENTAEMYIQLVAMNHIMQGLEIGHALLCNEEAGSKKIKVPCYDPKYQGGWMKLH